MHAFMWSPKWILGHVLVLAVVVTFPLLGLWQLDRLEQARERNAAIEAQLRAPARPLDEAVEAGLEPYATVQAQGTYDADGQVLTAPRSREGRPGHHVLTPLETEAGAVLVDRGWVPFDRDGPDGPELAPPGGEVTVEGRLMPAERGDPGAGEFVAVIDPDAVGARTGTALLPVYLRLEEATAGSGLLPSSAPAVDEGNHLSYAIQWFLFTAVVAIGYPVLVVRTVRERRHARPTSGDEAPRELSARA